MGRSVKALVDTSLLVRYLTGDPPHLAEKAAQVLDGEETLGITEVALVETAYALESAYGVPRKDPPPEGEPQGGGRGQGPPDAGPPPLPPLAGVSFGDALIWAAALASGVKRVYTLDARFPEEEIAVGPPEDPGSG